ncbi:hypothetical protein [Nocardia sp. CDC160]|uniref:hypothetical protein n=1 Tax=Nocardia sp. CDC160 TaxID=3112166 RepID=UPI002DB8B060|nr:hypothetical protein [Nocardia sp. CDC160]MEC3919248.1 hypothetical protein [Nocardia sp. CDC160]
MDVGVAFQWLASGQQYDMADTLTLEHRPTIAERIWAMLATAEGTLAWWVGLHDDRHRARADRVHELRGYAIVDVSA